MVGSSMRQIVLAVVLAAAMGQTVGCGDEAAEPHASQTQQGESQLARPFAHVRGDELTLARSMLGQRWLMSPTLILASPTPSVMPMRPKVVAFELHEHTVALVEPQAQAVYDILPNHRLLDTFPVRASDKDTVTFAWGQGLHVVPLGSATVASDIPGSLEEGLDGSDPALPVVASYVKDVALLGNALELVQVSRVRVEQQDHTAELHVRFAPYQDNPAFEALPSALADGVGFFEVANLESGNGAITPQATRWDTTTPIEYAIAAGTPADVREVIAQGITYWNRVAGRRILQVSDAPAGQVVAKPHQVLVHWVPWTNAGFASSALQPDPTTGEILAGDIFLTSFWVDVAKDFVRSSFLEEIQSTPVVGTSPLESPLTPTIAPASPSLSPASGPPRAGVAGFAAAHVCSFGSGDAGKRLRMEMAGMPDPFMPMALDHLRAVVAHETGHTLGLRHNFAASLGSSVDTPAAQQAAWDTYVEGKGGARTSDSVMDYTTMKDTMLQGAALLTETFPYDVMAMRWGYGSEESRAGAAEQAKKGVFCTDMEAHLGVVMGCQPDDAGPNPLAFYQAALRDQERMVTALLHSWLVSGWIAPHKQSFLDVAAKLDPGTLLLTQLRPALEAFKQLQNGAQVLWVDRALGGKNWLNAKAHRDATLQAQRDSLAEVGGVPGLLTAAVRVDAKGAIQAGWLTDVANERLNAWQEVFLPAADVDSVRQMLPQVAERLEDLYLMILFAGLSGGLSLEEGAEATKTYAPGLAEPAWEAPLDALVASVILAEKGEIHGSVDGKAVTIGTPRYGVRTRFMATRFYSAALFQQPGWMRPQREALMEQLRARMTAVAGEPDVSNVSGLQAFLPGYSSTPSLSGRDASPDVRQWIDESELILQALDQAADE